MKAKFLRSVLLVFIVCIFAEDEATAGETHNKILTLEKIEAEFQVRGQRTTLQNQRADKDFEGKIFQGAIKVVDVAEHASDAILIESEVRGGELNFLIKDSKLRIKAAQLKRNDEIIIKAKLKYIYFRNSRYINVSGKYVAEFSDVESFDLKPRIEIK